MVEYTVAQLHSLAFQAGGLPSSPDTGVLMQRNVKA
jgi:hypothetical protein